ncbi:hypothetical protein ACFLSQ_05730 [Bacteroidota bacterium]
MLKLIFWFVFTIIISLLFSCAEEDPDLVNPPPQSETVRVRFFNLAGNQEDATLVLDEKVKIGPVSYGLCSGAVQPTADSSYAAILQNGQEVYRLNRKIRFTRNNFYTVFALPSAPNDTTPYRDIDTIITASTLSGLIVRDDMAYLRMFNAVPDSNRSYTLRLGCPNGSPIASNVQYRKLSPQTEVRSDGVPVSIIRNDDGKSEFIGLFNLPLEEKKQYLIVVQPPENGTEGEELYLLDEFSESPNPKTLLIQESDLTTEVRTINLSEEDVKFIKYPDSTLTEGIIQELQSKSIGSYVSVSACGGQSLDSLAVLVSSDTASQITASFDVSEKYTLLTFDSADVKAHLTILAEPFRIEDGGNAVVRVIHAAYNRPELIVSMAARDDATDESLGYRSGDLISQKISYGKISEPVLVVPGDNLPLTVFTTSEPARLVYTSTTSFKGGKEYLLLLTYDTSSGEDQLYLIENNEINSTLEPLPKGVFAQFVNLIPGIHQAQMTLEPILHNVKLNYGASLATVISEGQHNLTVSGKDSIIDANSAERILFIFAGDESQIDLLPFTYEPFEVSFDNYQRRFVNASREINMISVKENSVATAPVAERISYGKSSNLQEITLERNLSLFFVNTKKEDSTLYRVDDLPFPFGKNYTIIFGGRSIDTSFSVVVQQEY